MRTRGPKSPGFPELEDALVQGGVELGAEVPEALVDVTVGGDPGHLAAVDPLVVSRLTVLVLGKGAGLRSATNQVLLDPVEGVPEVVVTVGVAADVENRLGVDEAGGETFRSRTVEAVRHLAGAVDDLGVLEAQLGSRFGEIEPGPSVERGVAPLFDDLDDLRNPGPQGGRMSDDLISEIHSPVVDGEAGKIFAGENPVHAGHPKEASEQLQSGRTVRAVEDNDLRANPSDALDGWVAEAQEVLHMDLTVLGAAVGLLGLVEVPAVTL